MSTAVLESVSIWSSIQPKIKKQEAPWIQSIPSIHLSPKSLQICTESLCSETGSDEFFESDFFSSTSSTTQRSVRSFSLKAKQFTTAASPARKSFPPPLSSLSRQMRAHRMEGRLIVQAVPVPQQNCLHAERLNGRLLLTFKNSALPVYTQEKKINGRENEIVSSEKDEQEDRNEVIPSVEVHRSSTVLGKREENQRVASNITAMAASSERPKSAGEGGCSASDCKMLFMSKRKNLEELVHDMRRCSELRKPLFIWEPGCIATSF